MDEYIRLLENRIAFCSAVGGDAVVVHPPGTSLFYKVGDPAVVRSLNREDMERLRRGLKRSFEVFERVKPLCNDLGVTIAVENVHPNDPEILQCYFEKYTPEFVGFCYDSGHANFIGNFDQLVEFGDRLRVTHLHDNRGEWDDHQPPFWGSIDWKRVVEWIRSTGYGKPLNFEIIHNPKLFDGSMEEYLIYTVDAIKKVQRLF